MLENISIIISIIIFLVGIIKLWSIDDLEELTLTAKDKLYKIILSFFKDSFIYFIYLFFLGAYYHMFNFLVNDNAIYYFLFFISLVTILTLLLVIFWIFDKTDITIVDKYKNELKILNFLCRLSFIYLCISIWINEAAKIGLANYKYFYSSENIYNVIKLSAILAIIFYVLSKVLSKFYNFTISKKNYYVEKYPDYSIIKIVDNQYILIKNFADNNYMYLDFKYFYNLKIFFNIENKINEFNFIRMFIVFILWIVIIFIKIIKWFNVFLNFIIKLLFYISEMILKGLEKREKKKLNKNIMTFFLIIKTIDKTCNVLNKFSKFILEKCEKLFFHIKNKVKLL